MAKYIWTEHKTNLNNPYWEITIANDTVLEIFRKEDSKYTAYLYCSEYKEIDLEAETLEDAKQECIKLLVNIFKEYVSILEGESNE